MTSPSRRDFLAATLAITATRSSLGQTIPRSPETITVPARAVTRGPLHHFFGYYDKTPWNADGRYLLGMESAFCDRQPKPGEELTVGMVDLKDGDRYISLDKTAAWCWQQGTMLQWLGSAPDREIIYNTVEDGQYVARIRDIHSGKTRTLPRPIYALSPDGRQAVTLDFARLNRLRPGYGYATLPEVHASNPAPRELGIWQMNLTSGKNQRIVSLADLAAFRPDDRFRGVEHWVNHLQFNPSGTRLIFLHRWKPHAAQRGQTQTRLFTVKPDGSDLRLHLDDGMTSHFDWKDDHTILAWARTKKRGDKFYEIPIDGTEPKIVYGDVTDRDGHCSYSPNREWVLNDTYPDKQNFRHLMLLRESNGRRYDLNKFHSPPRLTGPFRCDLHPRWNRTGTQVCIDSAHEPTRQLYILDVSEIVRA
ncbi:MAG: hypothetical protein LC104_18545 [Bacteroidales bacterium]|nr:hypothetical protein [Bacteroidales bacterium]